MTVEGDIAFRIYFKHEETGLVEDLIKSERVDSHLMMEEGLIVCELPGKCTYNFYSKTFLRKTNKPNAHYYRERRLFRVW